MSKMRVETSSMNAGAVYNLFSANLGKEFTLKEVATELGLTSPQVLGLLSSWVKKGILAKGEERPVGDKVYQTYVWNGVEIELVEKGANKSAGEISEKGQAVLNFLKDSPDEMFTAAEIAESVGTSPIAINGSVNGLVKRGLVERVEIVLSLPDGTEKAAKAIQLTEAGKAA